MLKLPFLKNSKNEQSKNNSTSFNSIIHLAHTILESDHPQRIYELIYTLGKLKQFQRIQDCITGNINDNHDSGIKELFINGEPFDHKYSFYKSQNIKTREDVNLELDPSKNIVFTYPWEQERLIDAFLKVGENVGDKWVHDPQNHRLTLITPLNIGVITNGNHSAAINIITNESLFKVTEIVDLSPIYDEIYTNGTHFMYKSGNRIIGNATSVEMAAIFEIGRKIQTLSLNRLI